MALLRTGGRIAGLAKGRSNGEGSQSDDSISSSEDDEARAAYTLRLYTPFRHKTPKLQCHEAGTFWSSEFLLRVSRISGGFFLCQVERIVTSSCGE